MKSMLSDNRTKTIERGHQYFATDRNGECWSYQYKPEFVGNEEWRSAHTAQFIGFLYTTTQYPR